MYPSKIVRIKLFCILCHFTILEKYFQYDFIQLKWTTLNTKNCSEKDDGWGGWWSLVIVWKNKHGDWRQDLHMRNGEYHWKSAKYKI